MIATEAAWKSLGERQMADPELRGFVEGLIQQARPLQHAPTLERQLEGRRLLGVSREALRGVLLSAFAWRATGEEAFLARAKADLLAVATFQNWNPNTR